MQAWNVTPLTLAAAGPQWRALQARHPRSPFLTYAWFETLAALAGEQAALECYALGAADEPTAFGCVARRTVRRARIIPVRTLFLHETGDPELDRLTLEHNGLAAPAALEPELMRALLEYLLRRSPGWDALSLGWLDRERWAALERAVDGLPLTAVVADRKPYYFIDLAGMRGLDDYLAGLSRNSRYQLRRAIRGYGDGLQLERTVEPTQALDWFRELVAWHQAEWNARGRPGAFATPFMRLFHHRLITLGAAADEAQLVRVSTADGPIGYLYNLQAGNTLYNYQSGLRYSDNPKLKPGLVCHALAIGRAASEGRRRYDLLMGDGQYKRSLANGQGEMVQVRLERRRLRFALVRAARRIVPR